MKAKNKEKIKNAQINKWDKNFKNDIQIIVGDEWFGGNLAYHLKSRPKWYNNLSPQLKDIKFDLVLDDGPHSLESQIFFVKHYSKLLKDDGILIVEDIQNIDHFKILTDNTPNELKQYIKTYDLRKNKNRYDDLVFSINLNL